MEDYDAVLTIHPQHVNALTSRGVLKERLNDVAGALAD